MSHGDFLNPADRIESPGLQVGSDGFLDPLNRAAIVLLFPDLEILRVAQAGGVDVIEAESEERLAVRCDEKPVVLAFP